MSEVRYVVNARLVKVHGYISVLSVPFVLLGALIIATKLVWPGFIDSISWLQFGRLRVFHTNGVIYGWLGLSFLTILNYIVPKLANRPLFSERLAWWTLIVWITSLIVGLGSILAGKMQAIEYAEFPWYADILFALAFVMALINYLATIFKSEEKQLYVSSWYFVLGFTFSALNYVMANTIPAYFAPGSAGAAIEGLWIHNAVGLLITPLGVGIVYYMLPVMLNKPLYSHLLSLIGFWTLAFFYPLTGAHHYLFSPIPMWVQAFAVGFSVILFVVVVTVVYNWLMTLKGEWHKVPKSPALAFIVTGIFTYMAVCTQGPFHSLFFAQKILHFTDWIVAHAHMALLGTFSMFNIGALFYIWPKITGRQLYSNKLAWWSYWLIVLGFFVFYFIPLTVLGVLEGFLWMNLAPFSESILVAKPMWFLRLLAGFMIYTGFVLVAINLVKTSTAGVRVTDAKDTESVFSPQPA